MSKIFVTGGAGFIGSNFVKSLLNDNHNVINYDLLTYAASKDTLKEFSNTRNFKFIKGDISDKRKINKIFKIYKPDIVVNFAAETHVDRSIDSPEDFIKTNILGVFKLLDISYKYWKSINNIKKKKKFRFLQISTDEVYGSIKKGSASENTLLSPNSPYSASKSSADHIVYSYFKTYNFPSIITRSSNNYGPYQFPEKLIPLIIIKAIKGERLPIYGDGKQIRNWLYVNDNVQAIKKILSNGKLGNIYNVGGNVELTNLKLVQNICRILDKINPRKNNKKYEELIKFVADRPGHDKRYSLNSKKVNKLSWKANTNINIGLELTIKWYLSNKNWWLKIKKTKYKGQRLGKI